MERQEDEISLKLNVGMSEAPDKESLEPENTSSYVTPLITPTASLRSSDSSVSSCSDISVDIHPHGRSYLEDCSTDSSQDDSSTSTLKANLSGPITSMRGDIEDTTSLNNSKAGRELESARSSDIEEYRNGRTERFSSSVNEESEASPRIDESDSKIWLPPDQEDVEDAVGSLVNSDDDDDEYGDGMNWGKPSNLNSSGEEGSRSYKYKEEKQKAMDAVKKGKFMALVVQLLKSVDIPSSGGHVDSWVDIVCSLSWEAAAFVKPDTSECKAMDPDGYVKIKCIETGSRSQSHVIRGLVFKKHAAHKRMPTRYKNPRLLLIQGALGLSSDELSSFGSMQKEKDSLKSVIEMIDKYHPNVILVEKAVSRDIQESILSKGMTVVSDMKLHRLQRVARCTGSPILSSDILVGQMLRQCDSFYFEKFVEEHASLGEGGKRPSKTLMFLEGFPTRLGCSILLMGATSDELKRIKYVVRCAVVMAYHLILETSFLMDQRAMFSTIPGSNVANFALTDQQQSPADHGDTVVSSNESTADSSSAFTMDIPISNGLHEEGNHDLLPLPDSNSAMSFEPYNPLIFSGFSSFSTSLRKVVGDSFQFISTSNPTYFSFDGRNHNDQVQTDEQVPIMSEVNDRHEIEPKVHPVEEKSLDTDQQLSTLTTSKELLDPGVEYEKQGDSKDRITEILDSESILVLMSTRNASRGTICEQSHFSHIKFYRNFDVPLGKFLRDNLLNQRLQCKTCGESPEDHFFYYAHHNKQLTIQVRRIPEDKSLPGETEGKIWMWSCCGKCIFRNGSSESTKRVLISTGARGLSFGKFLELSFSDASSLNWRSSCGHSFQKDFLYFFGLGPMVAKFKYSSVATYSVSLPPLKLEFSNAIRAEFLQKAFDKVYMNGNLMFGDIEKFLEELRAKFVGINLNLDGSIKKFSEIEDMLKEERSQFEVHIQNAIKNGYQDATMYKFLRLNKVRLELLLESYLWDRRLHSLMSTDITVSDSKIIVQTGQTQDCSNVDGFARSEANNPEITVEIVDDVEVNSNHLNNYPVQAATAGEEPDEGEIIVEVGDSVTHSGHDLKKELFKSTGTNTLPVEQIQNGLIQGCKENDDSSFSTSVMIEDIESSLGKEKDEVGFSAEDSNPNHNASGGFHVADANHSHDDLPSSAQLHKDVSPISSDLKAADLSTNGSQRAKTPFSVLSKIENDKGWIWVPFDEILREYMKDLHSYYLSKFGSVTTHSADTTAYKLIAHEGSRLHIPVGADDYIVSDYEDEFSSIIACALTLMKDLKTAIEDLGEDAWKDKGTDARTSESSQSLPRIFSLHSPQLSSNGSFSSDGVYSSPSISFEESHSSSFDGLELLDSLVSLGAVHPEISMGSGKLQGKRKYSVVCLYANEFFQLRHRCCQSEVDYIASLSRCRNWDAKGGKSKSFFAKTLDDRFIIKEIKRTEFESFVKFAPNYFKYMNECYEKRNQTCLAKILGIYQVVIRQAKNGKETKHDLMVMENLSFGRNVTRQYDLKGALHARHNSAGNGAGDVLLDQNFVDDMNISPLYVSRNSKRNLQRAVWNDTTFLHNVNVMDYSLLVGVDTQKRELVCGIIDYLRQYTWDKQLENWVKSSLVVPRNQLPTIISPKEYKKRFRKFIDTHFLSVPDHWCSQRSSNPCRLCGTAADSSHTKSREMIEKENGVSHAKVRDLEENQDSSVHSEPKE